MAIHTGLFLLLLAVHALDAQERQFFTVDRESQWQDWSFPAGLLKFADDGSFSLVSYDRGINAALDADQFVHLLTGDKEAIGGIREVGSTARQAGVAAANTIDGDPSTYWKPDPDAPVDDWWIEIDLGRLVAVSKIRLIFPDTTGARPFRDFRVFGTRGYRIASGQDLFAYAVLGGTTKYNDAAIVEYELDAQRRLGNHIVRTGGATKTGESPRSFQQVQYIWIQADAKSDDAALAEVEVITFGRNIALEAVERGGSLIESSGRGTSLIDGDINSSWAASLSGGVRLVWLLDLGARFWVKNLLFLGAEIGGWHNKHFLLGSDQPEKLALGDIDLDLLYQMEDAGSQDLQFFMQDPVPMRYIAAQYNDGNSGKLSEVMVFPIGHVAGVQLESGFIDLGDFAGDGRVKQITAIHWDADEPEGTAVWVQTRAGFDLSDKFSYYRKDGTLLADEQQWLETNQFLRGPTDTTVVAGNDWSPWSAPYIEKGVFLSPSPRRFLQIRLVLESDRPEAAPSMRGLDVEFTEAIVKGAEGEVAPRVARPGQPQSFIYKVWGDFSDEGRFDQLLFVTPSRVDPDSLQVLVGGVELEDFIGENVTDDTLFIRLPQAIERGEDTVAVKMSLQIDRNPTLLKSFVGRTEVADLWQEVQPTERERHATQVFFPAVPSSAHLVSNFVVVPRVATPNGDELNDEARIRFLVLNVSVEPEVWIHSLDGQPVVRLDGGRGPEGLHEYAWSGRDRSGVLAPPGIYLCRVELGTQSQDQSITRTIGLAY